MTGKTRRRVTANMSLTLDGTIMGQEGRRI